MSRLEEIAEDDPELADELLQLQADIAELRNANMVMKTQLDSLDSMPVERMVLSMHESMNGGDAMFALSKEIQSGPRKYMVMVVGVRANGRIEDPVAVIKAWSEVQSNMRPGGDIKRIFDAMRDVASLSENIPVSVTEVTVIESGSGESTEARAKRRAYLKSQKADP